MRWQGENVIKAEIIKAFERFEEIKTQGNAAKSNIYLDFNVRVNRYGTFYHYLFAEDVKKDVQCLVSIKGIEGLPFASEIETFEDIVKVLGVTKNG